MKRGRLKNLFRRKSVWAVLYAVYLALIMVSVQSLYAELVVDDIRKEMETSYNYDLSFFKNGKTSHYDVVLHDSEKPGRITLTYWTQDNKLDIIMLENIDTLKIDVQSLFEDEAEKVFKRKPTEFASLDMDYWLDAGDGIFTIDIKNNKPGSPMNNLTFTKFPEPTSVLVDDQEWWKGGTNYEKNGNEITISKIPTGQTTVVIYFKAANLPPVAAFTTDPPNYADVNENITFNGKTSYDLDGNIDSFIWDFGDGNQESGDMVYHQYTKPGNYTIRLTVRDDAVPGIEDWIEKNMTVEFGAQTDYDNDGLRDKWEWDYFTTLEYDGDDDPDKDDFTNQEEYIAGTNPADSNDHPSVPTEPTKGAGGDAAGQGMNIMLIAIPIILILIIIPVAIMVMKSKKMRDEEDEKISEMEAKIEKMRKAGLPTGDLEKVLREAKAVGKGKKSGSIKESPRERPKHTRKQSNDSLDDDQLE